MANTESKRSTHPKQHHTAQPRTTAFPKPKFHKAKRHGRGPFYHFKEVSGKTLEFVEFYTRGEYHCLDVRFQDKTSLTFVIEPGFTVEAEHSDWKTGNWRPLKRWSPIRSQGFSTSSSREAS
jgi:hypothetical protein